MKDTIGNTDLISRLEAAEQGSREFDGLIAVAIDAPRKFFESKGLDFAPEARHVDGPECFGGEPTWGGGGYLFEAPPYTTSMDAAMSLIPEGWFLEVTGGGRDWSVRVTPDGEGKEAIGLAASLALALTAASLRAREAG